MQAFTETQKMRTRAALKAEAERDGRLMALAIELVFFTLLILVELHH